MEREEMGEGERRGRDAVRRTALGWGNAGLLLLVLAVALAGYAVPCHGLDTDKTRASLEGLPGVYLMVEDLRLEIEEDGLTRNEIHGFAKKLLTSAGIRLLSEEEWQETPGRPWLYLYAHVMRREYVEERVYLFNISIEVKQQVRLSRAPDAEPIYATTWSRSILGKSGWLEDIRKGVELSLQDFIEAYRSVNGSPEG
ncbi:MAG: hypothetical protein K9M82_05800 [Deltaproteobacteria bacterium]|nr:hypothetical protein [Deltaproteobacteria bacterium]